MSKAPTRAQADIIPGQNDATHQERVTKKYLQVEITKAKYNLLKWQIGIAVTLAAIMAKGFGWLGF